MTERVAIVAGGGAVGRATALALAREGADVMVAVENADEGQATVEMIGPNRRTAMMMLDVTDEEHWRRLIDATLNAFHRLDVLAYTAQSFTPGGLAQLSLDRLRAHTRYNLQGSWLGLKHAGPAMRIYGHGAIAVVSSSLGLTGDERALAPSAAGAAIRLMVRSTAAEFAARDPKVRVNAILVDPAYLDLDLATAAPERSGATNAGRSPYDVANAILYACADGARFLTGVDIVLDGATAQGPGSTVPAGAGR
jgi:NAD(P)-dependent dehydrogenase (short-subunit alcohol dehydrogenase family)